MIGLWFKEGANAFGDGLAATDCPYPIGSEQEKEWLAGWTEAKRFAVTGESGASTEPHDEDE